MSGISTLALWLFLAVIFFAAARLIIQKWTIPLRGFTQLSLFLISEITFVCNKGLPCANCPLSFGVCPIGTTQRIAFIRQFSYYIPVILILITGIFLGTLTCGWGCPVGFIQDILNSLSFKKIKLPEKTRFYRPVFAVLLLILIFSELRLRLFSKLGISLFHEYIIIAGGLLILTALFVKRPFCNVFCPIGYVYGKLNKISPLKVKLNRMQCKECGKCADVCIAQINPARQVNGEFCLKCFNCRKTCEFQSMAKTALKT